MDPASTSFVLGYHGCDRTLAEKVFSGRTYLRPSDNDYDWLGDGIYFWEHNPTRAFHFAREVAGRPHPSGQKIKAPAVVGAIIDLGLCLNLLDSRSIDVVRLAYADLAASYEASRIPMPKNSLGPDLLNRKLDCAVLRSLHVAREEAGEAPFETVRAAFVEGERLYPGAGFAARSHIQICVRRPGCIKGFFRPLDEAGKPLAFR